MENDNEGNEKEIEVIEKKEVEIIETMEKFSRCRIPECEGQYPVYNTTWWPNKNIDRCTRPLLKELTGGTCTNDSFSDAVAVCTEWVYETNDTVVAALNLACQPWKINMIGTMHNIGMALAMMGAGWLCDRYV
ncbi:hypothetical protein RR46_04767 [Papilio xuthus]|uniref:Uncharacterized protein n=1 Tax=Papilio xuthus TaxID=66420 RepID=A0A194Q373_PAPXU|nr:hypothetical protein RR46_04767 [Papilio xuthus]